MGVFLHSSSFLTELLLIIIISFLSLAGSMIDQLTTLVQDRLFNNFTDESRLNVDRQSNGNVFQIITREPKSKSEPVNGARGCVCSA